MNSIPFEDIDALPPSTLIDAAEWLRESLEESHVSYNMMEQSLGLMDSYMLQLSLFEMNHELARLKALKIQQEVILDAQIETFHMMTEDPWYDEDDQHDIRLCGYDREEKYNKLHDYIPDVELVIRWLNYHENHRC